MNHFKHELCNGELGPAAGDESSVDTLHVRFSMLDGAFVTRSFWRPTGQELALLNAGGCVALSVMAKTHAPLRLDVVPE